LVTLGGGLLHFYKSASTNGDLGNALSLDMANLIIIYIKKSQNSRILLFIFGKKIEKKKKIAQQKKTLRWTGDHPQEDLGQI
jgi:hypothetical protein